MKYLRRIEEEDSSLAYRILEHLWLSLQLLAAQAQDQLAHFSPIPIHVCKEDELALEFDHWASCVHTYWELTQDQLEKLTTLNDYLSSLGGQSHSSFWTDEALFADPRWEHARHLAKLALASFGWPVEIPPPEQHPERYVPSRSFDNKPED